MTRFLRPILLAVVCSFLPLMAANAQVNEGGTPLSFKLEHKQTLQSVPEVSLVPHGLAQQRAEDAQLDFEPNTPFRFGYNIDTDLNPQNAGVWETMKDDYRVWRLAVKSAGARSLNLLFDDFEIPEGAQLFVYSKDRSTILGAFTARNNQDDRYFATTMIWADEVVIEYIEPVDAAFQGSMNLARVTHGYRDLKDGSFGASGSCNLNVACEAAEGWEEQISSVARMVVNGNSWCTGQLINNTANDSTPYFLSANHCFTQPGQLVFMFNYESETCQNPATPPSHDAMSGAVSLVRHSPSDVWLLQLNQEVPEEYELFFSGWNRTMDETIDGYIFGVHHPRGDIKKFSYLFDGVTTSSYLGAPGSGSTHWRVGTWADGTTTEPGSSGSGLFDGEGRLIGQLHGGYAACGNELEDWYGKFGVSWTGGGTEATSLEPWLDPLGTGALVLDAFNPFDDPLDNDAQLTSILSPNGMYQITDPIIPEFRIRNAGLETITALTVGYEITDESGEMVNSATQEWTGELENRQFANVLFPEIELPAGSFEILAFVDLPGDENPDNDSRTGTFSVVDCTQPAGAPFSENFLEGPGAPDCWTITDNIGNGQVWQFGNIGSRGIDGGVRYAYLDSDAYGSGNSQNSDLITPRLDLTHAEDVTLSFTHYFRDFNSSTATVAYSLDDGETWTILEEWNSGQTANPAFFSMDVPEADGESAVRFKWNFTGSWDWYWSVDDVLVDATVNEPEPEPVFANVFFIHNASDPALAMADLFLDGELAGEGVPYRVALEDGLLPAGEPVTVGIAPSGSDAPAFEQTLTFSEDGNYVVLVSGLLAPELFAENPDNRSTALRFEVYSRDMMHEPSESMHALYLYHGVTDAPNLDIALKGEAPFMHDFGFGDMVTPDFGLLPDAYELHLTDAVSGDMLFAFTADLSGHEPQLVGIVASGFANPSENQDGAPLTLLAVFEDGEVTELQNVTSTAPELQDIPAEFLLAQNYPNPFNPTTQISYQLTETTEVVLEVFNLTGQRVAKLVNGTQPAGTHTVTFDAGSLSSGVYLYRIQAGSFTQTHKMLLLK
ncbi:Por secretion system C-terminal sorting domain-containing protein [Cyclonatronum proteinivorum]|uniref:Por secretion system C-terminal sorting domain-containing protein n=1 Tax=Cyclonatronum proteinivorum TaxID=1457365 RepID=A0A345UKI1_9BACT|nr:T9SS type A sorting domain-containing protein [Cyclonatronum proteinivorum]AXJ00983.1 Por secretion system C-terminal sorting domain-containing protein [Cyclonatronum proteinivorum]